ncbi:hypothetical protein OHC33_005430 [Knufia fluminis]|uniref:Alpha-methylacyl-CoA racemase n=1 Tax=Knufia fluminis TaxID=191047 RepID=A0AAN8F8V2_9EURO|nr:hypothetical protein OHC33_005430 [Knufia fluminis]
MSQPPLTGLKVLELSGLAPGPFCGFLLSSYGASVLRIDRPGPPSSDLLTSYKSSIPLDLKSNASRALFLTLVSKADILIDPYRPGVLEKLNLDPVNVLQKINPRLITVRLTGFRRDGKYKDMAGHDINYLAVSGVLSMLGAKDTPPLPPGNVLADFAGGGHVAFTGVLLALIHRGVSGKGQVVEANMADGVNYLGTFPRLLTRAAMWSGPRGTNTLDGGAPYYGCYETKDVGRYMSVGALEPQFFAEFLKGMGLTESDIVPEKGMSRDDKRAWDHMRLIFTARFKTKTRAEWEKIFDGTDACCVPVLTYQDLEERDYDFRPIVGLTESPGRKVELTYDGKLLKTGEGSEKTLKEWLDWTKGQQWDIGAKGAAEQREKSKL